MTKPSSRRDVIRELGVLPAVTGKVFYQGDQHWEGTGPKRATTRLNQMLFERGMTPPWVWSQERCQRYWATRTSDGPDNRPIDYAEKPPEIVDFMSEFWSPDVTRDQRILELGTNAGANLARLHDLGYAHLAGVEINPAAIAQFGASFPEARAAADITVGAFEDAVPGIPDNSVDTVFAMAVLLHVHPAGDGIFDHMVRIARQHICVIEHESVTVNYIFARNYRRVFASRGAQELRAVEITQAAHPELGAAYWGYTARLFRVSQG
jgi:SAM-dependent methyltransferase